MQDKVWYPFAFKRIAAFINDFLVRNWLENRVFFIYEIHQAKSESKIYILLLDLDREESGAYKEIRATSQNARQQRGNIIIHFRAFFPVFSGFSVSSLFQSCYVIFCKHNPSIQYFQGTLPNIKAAVRLQYYWW